MVWQYKFDDQSKNKKWKYKMWYNLETLSDINSIINGLELIKL